ncbi:MAG: N-6 DNA methylase [Candidatus Bathyarchaeia archaeon]
MLKRERKFQDELFFVLAKLVKDKRFAGLELDVVTGFPIHRKEADIVVLKKPDNVPVLIIETKRKIERVGHWKVEERFDPYGRPVVGQALSYSALAKDEHGLPATPLFATANRDALVLFGPLDNPWDFLNKEFVDAGDYEFALEPDAYMRFIHGHYLLDEKHPLREEFLEHLLDVVCRLWQREVLPEKVRRPFGDWLIGSLRYFVDSLSSYYVNDALYRRLVEDSGFVADLNREALKAGYRNGISDVVGEDLSKTSILARMMTYVLTNKIIFYKVLERSYPLSKLKPILEAKPDISSAEYLATLKKFFDEAIRVTGDFEQIFYTGLFDHIVLSDELAARKEVDDLIRLLSTVEMEQFGDVVGYIYEDLIPAEERHQMGQFYTPPPIAELIVKWCLRSPSDYVLDPGCGSGTFLVQSYWRLVELKTGRRKIPAKDVHVSTLKQLYSLDINPFPTQLTAMNLAMKNVRAPTTEANIMHSDFFTIVPKQEVLAPHAVMTTEGMKHRVVKLPEEGFDAVVGNPPYTRWTEIPGAVQDNIKDRLGAVLSKYSLHADVARGKEPGIYVHFILWAKEFLKPGGRLGMIISDSWLQTDYGVEFGRFLLENFKVKALIDVAARVFPVPLVGACIILLEKPVEGERVEDNQIVFTYLSIPKGESLKVDEILQVIKDPKMATGHYRINVVRQGDLPKDQKWINFIFNAEEILEELRAKTIKMGELFDPSYGNATYLFLASRRKVKGPRNLGSKEFFYFNEAKVKEKGVKDFVYPALTSSRYAPFFTFTDKDWKELRDRDADCYFFMCHKPRDTLPKQVLDYIRWGETECKTLIRRTRGGGKICSQALACQEREKQKQHFYGWYDLGGVVDAPIIAVRQSQYKTRFIWNLKKTVTYDAMITFTPKMDVGLNDLQIKALLAYLNSSFTQLYIESISRITGLGVAALEVNKAEEMPILNILHLKTEHLETLATLFDKLDKEARKIGGADKKDNVIGLWDGVIAEIDAKIAEILQLPEYLPEAARTLAKIMMERRLTRTEQPQPVAIKGTTEMPQIQKVEKEKKKRKAKTGKQTVRLDKFIEE